MPAGNTYEAIATNTLSSAAATLTFSSIPGTYTDLILICSMTGNTTSIDTRVVFNSDTGSNYSATRLMGDGSSATSNRSSNRAWIDLNYVGGVGTTAPTTSILQINNYSNTTTNKTTLLRANEMSGTFQGTEAIVGLWRNTAAITSMTITASNDNFKSGSTFSLYGIASA